MATLRITESECYN